MRGVNLKHSSRIEEEFFFNLIEKKSKGKKIYMCANEEAIIQPYLRKNRRYKKSLSEYMDSVQHILGEPFCIHLKQYPPEVFRWCPACNQWECPKCQH